MHIHRVETGTSMFDNFGSPKVTVVLLAIIVLLVATDALIKGRKKDKRP